MAIPVSRYARALRVIAGSPAAFDRCTSELRSFADAIAADLRIAAFLIDRQRPLMQRQQVLRAAVTPTLSEGTVALLHLLLERGALRTLPAVTAACERLADTEQGRRRVTVETARAIPNQLLPLVTRTVENTLGRGAMLTYRVSPQCIGGIRMTINEYQVWDASIRGRLNRLAAALTRV